MRGRPAVCCCVAVSAFVFMCACASAWWSEGHELIDRAAMQVLPRDMPAFFIEGEATIISYSAEPDLWSLRSFEALRSAERSDHFLDLELLRGRPLPATRKEYFDLCRRMQLNPYMVGALPYAIQEHYERLVLAFAAHRRLPNDARVKAQVLYIAGVLSHYTGDASQPLHCTVHYDGRVGPDAVSPRTGIHLKMDALFSTVRITRAEVVKGLQVRASGDVFALALRTIRESQSRVECVYQLESLLGAGEETAVAPKVRSLALECARAGAELTATVWYSAWVNSGRVELPEWYRRGEHVLGEQSTDAATKGLSTARPRCPRFTSPVAQRER